MKNGNNKAIIISDEGKNVTAQPTPLPHIILNLLDYLPSAEN